MQKIPGWRSFYKALLPVYPIAFEQFDFSDYDLVISQTTRFAKSVITKPETLHICYMHTPPRFLWNFSGEKNPFIFKWLFNWLRVYDKVSSQRPEFYIAGSENARSRIKDIYEKNSDVLYPYVDTENIDPGNSFDGGYYLVISRLNKYKHVDVVVKTCNKLGLKLKVVGRGPELENLKSFGSGNIQFFSGLPDQILMNVISGCKALIVAAEEDFGLTPLEAQILGKPVIALKKGGTLETVIEGKTGVFFENPTIKDLSEAIGEFELLDFKSEDCKMNAEKFSKAVFKKRLIELVEKYGSKQLY